MAFVVSSTFPARRRLIRDIRAIQRTNPMPSVSTELQRQKQEGVFDEIHEVVRVFTLYNEDKSLKLRITVVRYYHGSSVSYDAWYERSDEHGKWESISCGAVLSGSESEESAIMMAIGLARRAVGH